MVVMVDGQGFPGVVQCKVITKRSENNKEVGDLFYKVKMDPPPEDRVSSC